MRGWGWGCRAEWIVELIVVIGCFGVHFGFFGKKGKEANILEEIKKKRKEEMICYLDLKEKDGAVYIF